MLSLSIRVRFWRSCLLAATGLAGTVGVVFLMGSICSVQEIGCQLGPSRYPKIGHHNHPFPSLKFGDDYPSKRNKILLKIERFFLLNQIKKKKTQQ